MIERKLTARGLKTRVFELGAGPPTECVVLLHGSPGSAEDWTGLLRSMGGLGRVVAFDLPGFGEADGPRAWDYSAGSHAEFIGAALEALGITRAHLVMHDLGGVGLLWAATHPDNFASAVLIDTGNLIGFRWHPLARAYRAPLLGDLLAAVFGRPLLRAGLRRLGPRTRTLPKEAVERMAAHYNRGTRRAAMRFYRATPAEAMGVLAPVLRPLDRPALVLWGGHDPFVPVEQAERQRETFPSAEVVVLEDSGHWPHIDDPEGAAGVVVPFLKRHLSAHEVG
jgi:pimeloyl-ACP methyl ester carboxylesterase